MTRVRRALVGTALVLLAVVLFGHGCYTPPVVMEAGRSTFTLSEFPEGTERVSLDVAPGIALEGVFVPARAPDAPVVLLLLESQASITQGARPYGAIRLGDVPEPGALDQLGRPETWADGLPPESGHRDRHVQFSLLARLRNLGCSTLVVDYEGVGASGGERTPDVLRRDAQRAWKEALARAGGNPSRVIVRGTSLGTLAAGTLLQDGVQPAAVIMIAPVRAETVAVNFFAAQRGALLAWLASWFLADPVDVDLLAEITRCEVPLLVVLPEQDFLLPEEEAGRLRAAAEAAGGRVAVRTADHFNCSLASRGGFNAEIRFLEDVLVGRLPDRRAALLDAAEVEATEDGARGAETRLHPTQIEALLAEATWREARLADAVARAGIPPERYADVEEWTNWIPERRWSALDAEGLERLLALGDGPFGVDAHELGGMSYVVSTLDGADWTEVKAFIEEATLRNKVQSTGWSYDHARGLATPIDPQNALGNLLLFARDRSVREQDAQPAEAELGALRLVVKALGFADRIVVAGDGSSALQVHADGAWHDVAWAHAATGPASSPPADAAADEPLDDIADEDAP